MGSGFSAEAMHALWSPGRPSQRRFEIFSPLVNDGEFCFFGLGGGGSGRVSLILILRQREDIECCRLPCLYPDRLPGMRPSACSTFQSDRNFSSKKKKSSQFQGKSCIRCVHILVKLDNLNVPCCCVVVVYIEISAEVQYE